MNAALKSTIRHTLAALDAIIGATDLDEWEQRLDPKNLSPFEKRESEFYRTAPPEAHRPCDNGHEVSWANINGE